MRAGILREKVGIYKPSIKINENGVAEEQKLLIDVVNAAVYPIKSKELMQAGTELTQQMIRVIARPVKLTEKNILVWNDEDYEIISALYNPRQVEILAKKVV